MPVPDPDPTFYFDADPDLDSDPDPNPSPSFTHFGKSGKKLFIAVPVYIFSLQHQRCHSFQYFEQFIEIFLENVKFSFTFVEIDTDPDQDLQALDADPDPPN